MPMKDMKISLPNKVGKALDRLRGKFVTPDVGHVFAELEELGVEGSVAVIQEALVRKLGDRAMGFVVPDYFGTLVAGLLSNRNVDKVLDPWSGTGALLEMVGQHVSPELAVGIERNVTLHKVAARWLKGASYRWEQSSPWEWLERSDEEFDLVACMPPWGYRSSEEIKVAGKPIGRKGDVGRYLLAAACRRLSPDGIGVFVMPPSFVLRREFEVLGEYGLRLDAFIGLPRVEVWSSAIRPHAAVIAQGKQGSIFVGEFRGSVEHDEALFSNFENRADLAVYDEPSLFVQDPREVGPEVAISEGVALSAEDGETYESVEARTRTRKILQEYAHPVVPMSELCKQVIPVRQRPGKPSKEPEETESNLLYVPTIGNRLAQTDLLAFGEKPPSEYLICVLDEARVDANYIAGYLNKGPGTAIRSSLLAGAIIPRLSRDALAKMPVVLPPVSKQMQMVNLGNRLHALTGSLAESEDVLWRSMAEPSTLKKQVDSLWRISSYDDSVRHWIPHLPFPLGSVLWTAYARADMEHRLRLLLRFFEASAAYLGTVLVSVAARDRWMREEWLAGLRSSFHDNLSLQRSTFGTWSIMCGSLCKKVRKQIDYHRRGDETQLRAQVFETIPPDVFSRLVDRRVLAAFQHANKVRNDWDAHGGIIGTNKAQVLVAGLEADLNKLRQAWGAVWSEVRLFRPLAGSKRKGVWRYNGLSLKGNMYPFEEITDIVLQHDLDEEQLYLWSPERDVAVELLPFLRLGSTPEEEKNACYFYNRVQGDGVRFVSYHFAEEPDMVGDFPDTLDAIRFLEGER